MISSTSVINRLITEFRSRLGSQVPELKERMEGVYPTPLRPDPLLSMSIGMDFGLSISIRPVLHGV